MIGINKQLRRYFILISVISIGFITAISNIGINYFFRDYIQHSRTRDDLELVEYIEIAVADFKGGTGELYSGIVQYAHGMGVEVRIIDLKDNIVLDSTQGMYGMHHGMGMGPKRRENRQPAGGVQYRSYPFNLQGQKVGFVEVGRQASILVTSEDQKFVFLINVIYIVAFVFSLLLSGLISIYISGKFVKPVLKVRQNASLISQGKYRALEEVDTYILELKDLSRDIDELANKLDYQESLRKRLTSDMAHELRTPLAALQSHVEAFIDGVWEPTTERLEYCHGEIIRLTKLIKDLSDLSRIENDRIPLKMKRVNLSQLLQNVTDNFEPMLLGKKIELDRIIEPDIWIQGDPDRLNQIFVNLLSNATKYTNEGGRVKIGLGQTPSKILFFIRDSGIGISKEDLPFVFERFYRGDVSRSRETGGSGIGLTITKGLVEAHHGRISIESELNQGTEVSVEFDKSS